jgi:membrane fusion protein (multidrug efflux system)
LVENAIVIPQRATFEILAKKYVFVIGDDHVVHQREIKILTEMDDVYLIESGLNVSDTIVLEGIRQVRDGEHVEFEYRNPEEVLANLKYKAE